MAYHCFSTFQYKGCPVSLLWAPAVCFQGLQARVFLLPAFSQVYHFQPSCIATNIGNSLDSPSVFVAKKKKMCHLRQFLWQDGFRVFTPTCSWFAHSRGTSALSLLALSYHLEYIVLGFLPQNKLQTLLSQTVLCLPRPFCVAQWIRLFLTWWIRNLVLDLKAPPLLFC